MLLYALTILVSAFLLFQVQPVIAKIILPWFGGSAAVWTTCLLFFQMVLLLGYLYAHAVVRYLQAARADAGALRAAAGQRGGAAHLSRRRPGSPPGGEDPTLGILRAAGRHRGAAVLSALHHRPAAAGLVRARASRARCRTGCTRSRTPARCSRCSAIRCCSSRSSPPTSRPGSGPSPTACSSLLCGVHGLPRAATRPPSQSAEEDAPAETPGRRASMPCGCCCRPAPRCCCWPSPITCRRTWRPSRSCGCCRSASTC